ncbi:helix-turn-helix domain-containing protein [Serratia fonticola]|uniref:helix-turn-helix domain-containing protein n=1 Tax=Serratia fonticola TaxID=47917 RepID=UPI003B00BAE9
MSTKLTAYVWDGCAAAGMKLSMVAIMARLADFSSDEGLCWPSTKTIARQIGASESTVSAALAKLVEEGWISRQQRRKGNRNTSSMTQLNVEKLRAAANFHPPESDTSKSDASKFDTSKSDPSESGKNGTFDPPESGHDPSVNSKQDPSVLKPVGQLAAPADEPQEDSLKIDYQAVLKTFHDTLPELPQVLKVTEARRKVLRKLWKEYDLNIEKWGAYLRYIAKKCRWMLEDRPDTTSGKTWRKKDFDYLITEKCYLSVKEERANDLPKVERLDTTARDDAYLRIVTQRRKPRNEVETIAQKLAGSLGRMTDYDARRAWTGIWAQAVAQASENDLGRLAG